ncbi:hypothetical protein C7974DRAFT_458837 [Boeremia exigua]|uniref:uncharacterized protein n=1 Tax=Boeremia exigua TaxID=749465 RepID=UPI001E8E61E4|nr:uncharacterized protein C7974DRAFT_458837 [Boeremia exigua]KAH6620562.1 hypothetical protein C7974DRAFT_458837 [Boeremia exigua]
MRLPTLDARAPALERRLDQQNRSFVIISIIVVAVFAILLTTYLVTLRFRRPFSSLRSNDKPRDMLPSLFSWSRLRGTRHAYSNSLQDSTRGPSVSDSTRDRAPSNASAEPAGVDRNTSIRSIMTLPSYSRSVRANERLLGRAGDRDGMDNVLELPESATEEEATRNAEMESLYQIRLARRAEAADREARRQARRDARARGDTIALADIRRAADAAADAQVSALLIAEHQGRGRERRVSAVKYADVGVARHDGTRVRAGEDESDTRGLLDGAASFGGRERGLTTTSTNSFNTLGTGHERGGSVSSAARSSVDSRADGSAGGGSRNASRAASLDAGTALAHTNTHSNAHSPAASRDASPHPLPAEDAPAYEDPPDYSSPVDRRAPLLPRVPDASHARQASFERQASFGGMAGEGRRASIARSVDANVTQPLSPSRQSSFGAQSSVGAQSSRDRPSGAERPSGPPRVPSLQRLPSLERMPSLRVVMTAPTPVDGDMAAFR